MGRYGRGRGQKRPKIGNVVYGWPPTFICMSICYTTLSFLKKEKLRNNFCTQIGNSCLSVYLLMLTAKLVCLYYVCSRLRTLMEFLVDLVSMHTYYSNITYKVWAHPFYFIQLNSQE